MSGQPSGGDAADLLRQGRALCSRSCGRLVDVAYWLEGGQGCFCSWSCLLHWPADMSGYGNGGVYAYWHDGRWLTFHWYYALGRDSLAEWETPEEDIVHLAAEALLAELEVGGWRVRTAQDRERRLALAREHRPDGRPPAEGSWLWLTKFVLLDPPTGVIATTSFGSVPG